MTSLLRLLRDHPDAVEADLSRYHRIDLRDLWTDPPTITRRQVLVRLRHLPETAATKVVLRGDDWTRQDQLLDRIRMETAAGRRVPIEQIKPHPASPHAAPAKRQGHDADAARDRAMKRAADRAARQPQRTPAEEAT